MTLFANPILLREFRQHARDRKTLLFAALFFGLLATIILVLWPRSGIFAESNSNEIVTVFLGAELTLMILLTPGFTATSITAERESGSFDLLSTSLLTPAEILLGKLTASLGMAFILLLGSLPIMAVCALSGGISLPTLLKAFAIVGMATLTYGLLGLACSALCRRSYQALALTYLGIITLTGATWLPAALLGTWLEPFQKLLQAIRALSPYEALFALRYAERYELSAGVVDAGRILTTHLSGMALLAALFLTVFARYVLRPPSRRLAKAQLLYSDRRTAVKRKLMFPFYLIDPLKRKKPIGNFSNPVFVAELRSKLFGNPKFILRALSTCIVLSLLLLFLTARQYATMIDMDKVRMAAIIFQLGVVALLAPMVSSGSISDERHNGTLLMLRLSPLRPMQVVLGKMQAAMLYVAIFLVSSLPVLAALTYMESTAAYWRIGAWLGVLVLSTTMLAAAGLCASSLVANTGTATAASYGFCILVCVGTLGVLLLGSRVSPEVQAAVLTFNPAVAALQITSDTLFADLPLLFGHKLWQNHLIVCGAITLLLLTISALRVHQLFRERE